VELHVSRTAFDGVLLLQPGCFRDHRGFFYESYSQRTFAEHGIGLAFVQDNHSRSGHGVLRGFHYQDASAPQFRLVRCTAGEILDVVVDLRVGSPTFGQWKGFRLSAENQKQLLMGPEFAHGFLVLSETAEVQYKCSGLHESSAERALAWNDPDVAVLWPTARPSLSARDQNGPSLADYLDNPAFSYGALNALYADSPAFAMCTWAELDEAEPYTGRVRWAAAGQTDRQAHELGLNTGGTL
jgi:dTDP-4-dehydrorhamnose 3,5-epimerase